MQHRSGLTWQQWIAAGEGLVALVADGRAVLRDGKVTPAEAQRLGERLLELLHHVTA